MYHYIAIFCAYWIQLFDLDPISSPGTKDSKFEPNSKFKLRRTYFPSQKHEFNNDRTSRAGSEKKNQPHMGLT